MRGAKGGLYSFLGRGREPSQEGGGCECLLCLLVIHGLGESRVWRGLAAWNRGAKRSLLTHVVMNIYILAKRNLHWCQAALANCSYIVRVLMSTGELPIHVKLPRDLPPKNLRIRRLRQSPHKRRPLGPINADAFTARTTLSR